MTRRAPGEPGDTQTSERRERLHSSVVPVAVQCDLNVPLALEREVVDRSHLRVRPERPERQLIITRCRPNVKCLQSATVMRSGSAVPAITVFFG